jgi:hypothetical protein
MLEDGDITSPSQNLAVPLTLLSDYRKLASLLATKWLVAGAETAVVRVAGQAGGNAGDVDADFVGGGRLRMRDHRRGGEASESQGEDGGAYEGVLHLISSTEVVPVTTLVGFSYRLNSN